MKTFSPRAFVVAAVLACGIAFAGDYLSFTQVQNGNGTNGTTQAAPTLATDGLAVKSSKTFFGNPIATQCQVAIRAAGAHTFTDPAPATGSWVRGWRYSLDPNGSGALVWQRVRDWDLNVGQALDAGTGTVLSTNTIAFSPIALKSSTNPATKDNQGTLRVDWTVENVGQTTTQDGGVGVLVECNTLD